MIENFKHVDNVITVFGNRSRFSEISRADSKRAEDLFYVGKAPKCVSLAEGKSK